VIEGPTSFHVVRVEGRRAAGPATFAEVQDKVRQEIRQEKIRRESNAYLEKLRRETVITTVFDDPGVLRASGERPTPQPGPVRR
jgi:peptidyl-prolyl cis-trans isomerase SurA